MINKKKNLPAMILLILGLSAIALPLYMTIVIAFKQPTEMTNSIAGILSLPQTWSLHNFKEAMRVTDFWHSLGNSLMITIVTVGLSLVIHSLMGYALARNRKESKFYNFVYLFIVSGMFVPFAILMMPLAKQNGIGKLVWRGVIVCCFLYADEYSSLFGIFGKYSISFGRSGKSRRSFHLENILVRDFSGYEADACNGCSAYCIIRME